MALLLLVVLYITKPQYFGSAWNFVLAVIFLVIFPALAYPVQPLVPGFRDRGREGQRSLAIWMAGIGYCLGIGTASFIAFTREMWLIYLTYFISGVLMVLFNKVLKIKASGHMCGVAGPLFASICFLGPAALPGGIILAAVYRASLSMQRHSISELLLGTAIPVLALLMSFGIMGVIN
jgi:Na+/phosphate symporter